MDEVDGAERIGDEDDGGGGREVRREVGQSRNRRGGWGEDEASGKDRKWRKKWKRLRLIRSKEEIPDESDEEGEVGEDGEVELRTADVG